MKYVVGRVDEFPVDGRSIVKLGGREIGIFRVEGQFFAIRNRCPHQGGPLCKGHVAPMATADLPGEPTIDGGPPLLACPWHGWEYDLRSGQSYVAEDPNVKSYRVTVESGEALAGEVDGRDGCAPGPYTAETFQVSVEDEYILVEA